MEQQPLQNEKDASGQCESYENWQKTNLSKTSLMHFISKCT
jgi:hypothetical protein